MHKVSGSCRPEHGNFVSTHSSVQMSLKECKHFLYPGINKIPRVGRKFMQKLRHKVSSLVQNFPIPSHNWKLDIARVKEIFFLRRHSYRYEGDITICNQRPVSRPQDLQSDRFCDSPQGSSSTSYRVTTFYLYLN